MSEQKVTTLPLQGKRILVTRTREQASALSERLCSLGAIPIEFPTIRITPPQNWRQLDGALARLYVRDESGYDWLVLTSVNGVHICFERLRTLGYAAQMMYNVRIATIGPATAAALKHYGMMADLMPDVYVAESVAAALLEDAQRRGTSLAGQRILLARAAGARKVLFTALQDAGALVDEVAAYSTMAVTSENAQGHEVLRLLQEQQLDVVTFTSSSTVRNFVAWLKSEEHASHKGTDIGIRPLPTIACIGPITAQTARELGLSVDIEAKEFTIDGLVEAISEYYEGK